MNLPEEVDRLDPKDRKLLQTIVDALETTAAEEKTIADMLAKGGFAINPYYSAAGVIQGFGAGITGKTDYATVTALLAHHYGDIKEGDMGYLEAMLFSQAISLQVIYANLSRRAVGADGLPGFHERDLILAFRAQGLCRATIEALNKMKHRKSSMLVQQAGRGPPVSASTPRDADPSPSAPVKQRDMVEPST